MSSGARILELAERSWRRLRPDEREVFADWLLSAGPHDLYLLIRYLRQEARHLRQQQQRELEMDEDAMPQVDRPSWGRWLLFVVTLPWALVTWVLGLLTLGWATHRPRFVGAAILTFRLRGWVAKRWRYSTTIGRAIFWNPRHVQTNTELDERIERHERVHVRQGEDLMLLSFLVGLAVAIGWWSHGEAMIGVRWWIGLWASGGLWLAPNFVTAFLRYGPKGVYRDAEHERSAYAQTDRWPNGESWWQRRDERRETQDGIT